jgi:hypothetical protein
MLGSPRVHGLSFYCARGCPAAAAVLVPQVLVLVPVLRVLRALRMLLELRLVLLQEQT